MRFHKNGWKSLLCYLGALLLVGSIVSACTPFAFPAHEAEASAQFTTTPCRFPITDQQSVECGDLVVPEDYSDPQENQIRLHVAIIKSSSDSPASDPLIILLGGPGAHALDRIDDTIRYFEDVLTVRDIVLFDQRGVGYSEPSLNCPELNEINITVIDEQLDRDQEFEHRLAIYRNCRDRLEKSGIVLQNYSAQAIAADVVALRQALGYDAYHLFGVSYGAHLALTIMRDYPEGLQSVVLDSVYPIKVDLAKETAFTYDHALNILFSESSTRYPDFEETFFDLVHQLDRSPIAVPVADPRAEDWYYITSFDGADLMRLTIKLVRWPQFIPHFPRFVNDIAAGQYSDLSYFLKRSVGDQLFSEGMNLSVICLEIDPLSRPPSENVTSSTSARIYNLAIEDALQKVSLCNVWLGDDRPPTVQSPLTSDIPTLVLIGELDTVVPPSWSERATAGLPNAIAISFPGTGHGVMASDSCAGEVVATFLLNPEKYPAPNCFNN
jgi:pimeloyl-ACP methyl ester carboxylesterase